MNTIRATINTELREFFAWLAGFLHQDTPQSSARLGAVAYTTASITYALGTSPDPIILAQLIAAAALFAGLRKSTEPAP